MRAASRRSNAWSRSASAVPGHSYPPFTETTGVTSWSGSGPVSYPSHWGTGRRPRRPTAPCHARESSAVSTSQASPPGRRSTSRASAARFSTSSLTSGSAHPATRAGRRCGWTTKAGAPCFSPKGWGTPSPPSATRRPLSTCAQRRTRRDVNTACTPWTRASASSGRRIPNRCCPRRTPPHRRSRRRGAAGCCPATLTARPTSEACARPMRTPRYLPGGPAAAPARCVARRTGKARCSAVRHSPIGRMPGVAHAP